MSDDTSLQMRSRFHQLIMSKRSEERLRMGCSMFDAAKTIALSGIVEQDPCISPQRMKEELFLRFYGNDFSEFDKRKILDYFIRKK